VTNCQTRLIPDPAHHSESRSQAPIPARQPKPQGGKKRHRPHIKLSGSVLWCVNGQWDVESNPCQRHPHVSQITPVGACRWVHIGCIFRFSSMLCHWLCNFVAAPSLCLFVCLSIKQTKKFVPQTDSVQKIRAEYPYLCIYICTGSATQTARHETTFSADPFHHRFHIFLLSRKFFHYAPLLFLSVTSVTSKSAADIKVLLAAPINPRSSIDDGCHWKTQLKYKNH